MKLVVTKHSTRLLYEEVYWTPLFFVPISSTSMPWLLFKSVWTISLTLIGQVCQRSRSEKPLKTLAWLVAKATSNVAAKLVAPPHSVPAVKPKEDAQASATRKQTTAATTTWLEWDSKLFRYLGKKWKNLHYKFVYCACHFLHTILTKLIYFFYILQNSMNFANYRNS